MCASDTHTLRCHGRLDIVSAKIGRMRLGTCLQRDYFVGCTNDVTDEVRTLCFGQKTCEVGPDTISYRNTACPPDLKGYLEVVYSCEANGTLICKALICITSQKKINEPVHI